MDFLYLFYQLKVFVMILSILYIIKYILNVVKVMRLEQGKVENTTADLLLLGLSLSYILTSIITGI